MAELEINEKVAGSNWSLWDFFGVGVMKSATERLLIPYVGNSSLKSGAVKIAGGLVLGNFVKGKGAMGKLSEYTAGGLIIDGVEDVVKAAIEPTLNGFLGGGAQASGEMVETI